MLVAEVAAAAVSTAHLGDVRVPKFRTVPMMSAIGNADTDIVVAPCDAGAVAVIVCRTPEW